MCKVIVCQANDNNAVIVCTWGLINVVGEGNLPFTIAKYTVKFFFQHIILKLKSYYYRNSIISAMKLYLIIYSILGNYLMFVHCQLHVELHLSISMHHHLDQLM